MDECCNDKGWMRTFLWWGKAWVLDWSISQRDDWKGHCIDKDVQREKICKCSAVTKPGRGQLRWSWQEIAQSCWCNSLLWRDVVVLWSILWWTTTARIAKKHSEKRYDLRTPLLWNLWRGFHLCKPLSENWCGQAPQEESHRPRNWQGRD